MSDPVSQAGELTYADYIQFLAALMLVIGLIFLAAAALRRLGPEFVGNLVANKGIGIKGLGGKGKRGGRNSRRLQVVETLAIDARHRAVLLRRDDKEHLVVLGGSNNIVVEQAIEPVLPKEDLPEGDFADTLQATQNRTSS